MARLLEWPKKPKSPTAEDRARLEEELLNELYNCHEEWLLSKDALARSEFRSKFILALRGFVAVVLNEEPQDGSG